MLTGWPANCLGGTSASCHWLLHWLVSFRNSLSLLIGWWCSRKPICNTHRWVLHWNWRKDETWHVDNIEECVTRQSSRDNHSWVWNKMLLNIHRTIVLLSLDSMEEASALASKVAIVARRLLGTDLLCCICYIHELTSCCSCWFNDITCITIPHLWSTFLLS